MFGVARGRRIRSGHRAAIEQPPPARAILEIAKVQHSSTPVQVAASTLGTSPRKSLAPRGSNGPRTLSGIIGTVMAWPLGLKPVGAIGAIDILQLLKRSRSSTSRILRRMVRSPALSPSVTCARMVAQRHDCSDSSPVTCNGLTNSAVLRCLRSLELCSDRRCSRCTAPRTRCKCRRGWEWR